MLITLHPESGVHFYLVNGNIVLLKTDNSLSGLHVRFFQEQTHSTLRHVNSAGSMLQKILLLPLILFHKK